VFRCLCRKLALTTLITTLSAEMTSSVARADDFGHARRPACCPASNGCTSRRFVLSHKDTLRLHRRKLTLTTLIEKRQGTLLAASSRFRRCLNVPPLVVQPVFLWLRSETACFLCVQAHSSSLASFFPPLGFFPPQTNHFRTSQT
jgi:hypothetical protein